MVTIKLHPTKAIESKRIPITQWRTQPWILETVPMNSWEEEEPLPVESDELTTMEDAETLGSPHVGDDEKTELEQLIDGGAAEEEAKAKGE